MDKTAREVTERPIFGQNDQWPGIFHTNCLSINEKALPLHWNRHGDFAEGLTTLLSPKLDSSPIESRCLGGFYLSISSVDVARNRGGTAVAIPGVEWKGLMDNELLKVLWAILLNAHFVIRYLLVRYVFTLFRRVRLDFPVIPGLTGNLVHRLS